MSTRIIALVFLGLTLGFIILMASVTFFVRDPLPIIAPNQRLMLHTTEIAPQIRSTVAIDGAFGVDVTVEHGDSQSPQVQLRPVDGAPIALSEGTENAQTWYGSGQLTRPGRWELVLVEGNAREVMTFIVRE
ncbi:MAG: hypothetical protein JJT99_00305 [Rhodobacteraceae bacterium]|nr:hypothetical protein [Paracoccaceae bacterium]